MEKIKHLLKIRFYSNTKTINIVALGHFGVARKKNIKKHYGTLVHPFCFCSCIQKFVLDDPLAVKRDHYYQHFSYCVRVFHITLKRNLIMFHHFSREMKLK